jgi:endoglucanase
LDTWELIKTLSERPGPAGRETATCQAIETLWRPLTDEMRTDAMGNLIALKRGSGPEPRHALMIAAHMDEIGLIVTGIEDGFVRAHGLGGTDRRLLLGLEVDVHGRTSLPGIIGSRPPHVLSTSERRRVQPWHEIFIDLGLPADEIEDQVRVGDHVTIHQEAQKLRNQRIAAKALDNRASVAALTLSLEALKTRQHTWDIYAVATVQEELGVKGAITSAYGVDPDLAVALDVTFAKQHNDKGTGTFELGEGPALGIGPNIHPAVLDLLREAADAQEIKVSLEPLPGSSGTDAWGIQVAREGIPTGLISIPVRYMHQPIEVAALVDVERTGRLLTAAVTRLSADFHASWEDDK